MLQQVAEALASARDALVLLAQNLRDHQFESDADGRAQARLQADAAIARARCDGHRPPIAP